VEHRRLADEWWRLQRLHHSAFLAWAEGGFRGPQPAKPELPGYPRLPDDLRGLSCGAKTRAGTPCKRTGLYDSGAAGFRVA
jgi:hypothetical protein